MLRVCLKFLAFFNLVGTHFLYDEHIPSRSRSIPNVGDEEVGNHFEPYKKCVQVMEILFKIK
ncbi:hypothetical protein ACJW31_04G008800 [Castanea mollissima]